MIACNNSASNGSSGTGGSSAVVDSHCPVDAGVLDYRSSVSGTFTGWKSGNIPTGSTVAYMERTQAAGSAAGQFLVMINSGSTGNSSGSGVTLTVTAGVGSPTPGTYKHDDVTSCGSLSLCVTTSGIVCFVTRAPLSCASGSQSGMGDWILNLTSVTPYVGDAGTAGETYYVVHGSFEAVIVSDQSDAGLGTEISQLTLCF